MNTSKLSKKILIFASFWPFMGALLHIMVVFGGYSWYEFFYALPPILESAKMGTWLAPIGTLVVATLMIIAGLYTLSGAGLIYKLPLVTLALVTLSLLFIIRGMLLFHLMLWKPEVIDAFRVISSLMFLVSGTAYALGTYFRWTRI